MTDELRIQALQAALDQANMMLIEQREVMQMALEALEYAAVSLSWNASMNIEDTITALHEVLGETE